MSNRAAISRRIHAAGGLNEAARLVLRVCNLLAEERGATGEIRHVAELALVGSELRKRAAELENEANRMT